MTPLVNDDKSTTVIEIQIVVETLQWCRFKCEYYETCNGIILSEFDMCRIEFRLIWFRDGITNPEFNWDAVSSRCFRIIVSTCLRHTPQ